MSRLVLFVGLVRTSVLIPDSEGCGQSSAFSLRTLSLSLSLSLSRSLFLSSVQAGG